jgi:hypothetical protein
MFDQRVLHGYGVVITPLALNGVNLTELTAADARTMPR